LASGYAFDEAFYLSSATLTFTVPASYNVDYNAPLIDFNVTGVASSNNPSAIPTDPGQWITLVPIPEPSTYSIIVGGIILGVLISRKRRTH
jgi:hypothetical protein